MAVKLLERHKMSVGDVRRHSIRFADVLDDDELLTGTPTATEPTGDINVGDRQLNSAPITISGKPTKVHQAAQFTISGQQVANTPYTITGKVQTTKGQVIHFDLIIDVEA